MTRKEQNKILDDKTESNDNQYKLDRLNAKISSGDLNEFLTRKYLKYKPNALDKARFEFSPLGKAFSTGLDKTVQGYYQEEGVIKLLKDIRDNLAGGNEPNGNLDDRPDRPDDRLGDDDDDDEDKKNKEEKYADMPDLETEEDAAERIADFHEQKKKSETSKKKDNYDDKIT